MKPALPDLRCDPRALRVVKRPIPVEVEFTETEGICDTLEGPVRYAQGDPILTGPLGESWPVRRDRFEASYEPVSPTKAGCNGFYRKMPSLTYALRLDGTVDVPVGWQADPLHGRPGDWLLLYEDGAYGVIREDVFRATYQPAEGETRWPRPP